MLYANEFGESNVLGDGHFHHSSVTDPSGSVQYQDYSVAAPFNARTGKFQPADVSVSKSFAPEDRALRQMSAFFDYNSYAAECSAGKPKKDPKLSRKQIEKLKAEKKLKKKMFRDKWLYED